MSSIPANAFFALAFTVVTAASSLAHAQSSDPLAEALFRDAKKLMADQRYDLACPKFAESHRLEPSAGALLGLALCHEAEGRLASAWSEFSGVRQLARAQGRSDREALAQDKMTELEPKLARLTIEVSSGDPSSMTITLDGRTIGVAALGAGTPVDPGQHTITASAPGKLTHRATVAFEANGVQKRIVIPSSPPRRWLLLRATGSRSPKIQGRRAGPLPS